MPAPSCVWSESSYVIIFFPLAIKGSTLGRSKLTVAVALVVLPLTYVAVAIGVNTQAVAVEVIFAEISVVVSTSCTGVLDQTAELVLL